MRIGAVTAGVPSPLGVWPTQDGVNAAVWSGAATAVDLCLFDEDGGEHRIRLPQRTGQVFHGHIAGIGEGARYGLRAHGPFDPASGARFDPSKLLVDPYAVQLDQPFDLHPAMFSAAEGVDSAPFMPRAVVSAPAGPATEPLIIPWRETVIYEAHVKGLTRLHPDVPEHQRGTFAGLAHPAIVSHLKHLGVTTLELLPTAAWIDERHLKALNLTNYWGYNPVALCAPDPRLAPGGWAEVRAATQALAQAGIETVLDVVFNHSGEGDHLGPTLSLRGLDNAGYYRLQPQDPSRYIDDSGTGNTLALDRPQGVALAMEAMRTWVRRGGVSGFRFDLATILARRPDGFDPAAPLLAAIDQDPELRALKLIAEPWDCGLGGYQLGRFPGAWGEWNDQFRDGARRFWRGDAMPLGHLADIWSGSRWTLAGHGRPSRGVNFVTAHDGFTLADLVAYETKHNQANGEDNRDGTDNNASWNCGAEGPVADAAILTRRARDQRALLATLLLARGTPMLSMGAEMGQSQGGNNNAYCQDGPITWLDWAGADKALLAFAQRLTAARLQHVALRADRFLIGAADEGPYPDVEWRRPEGAPMNAEDWDEPHGRSLVMVLAAYEDATPDRVVIVAHRGDELLPVRLPEPRGGHAWRLLIDSADDARTGVLNEDWIEVAGRSLVLLVEAPARGAPKGMSDEALAEVAQAAGIAGDWWSLDGERHITSPDTQRSLLDAMGFCVRTSDQAREALWRLTEAERRPLPFVQVARQGEPATVPVRDGSSRLEITAEDGASITVQALDGYARLPDLAPGRYALQAGAVQGRLIVAPERAHEPALARQGLLGLSVQLYSVRTREGARGMGDFGALAQLGREAAGQGLGLIGVNPFHALFPQDRSRASPYYPSDRRFLDPIYIDVRGPDGAAPAGGDDGALVDYPRVWADKIKRLEGAFETFERQGDKLDSFEAFLAQGGAALERFAAFQAIGETHLGPWRDWPGGLAQAHSPAVTAFIRQNRRRVRFHQYLQWLADSQLAEAAAQAPGLGLYRDLAVGAAPDGAEIWADAEQFAPGASIGAPPDPLGPQGQVWGMPPPNPHLWAQSGYDSFAALLRGNMRHAGALRIDHVLGLARLFWVPQGATAAEGAYVRYPLRDLLGVLALESARSQCLVVGEDLGTAPEGLRPALEQAGVYSYRVLPFERDGAAFKSPDRYPIEALACVTTHDLAPLEGWWSGVDLEERETLGLLTPDDRTAAVKARMDDKTALLQALAQAGLGEKAWSAEDPMSDALAGAIHAYVASSPSRLVLAQIEDLAGAREGVNLPGTDRERPNWRRRLSTPLPDLWSNPRCRTILAAMRQARAVNPPSSG